MDNKEYVLGLDIGGTNMRLGLVDREYNVRNVEVFATKTIYEKGSTPQNMAALIKDYWQRNLKDGRLLMVAAGFPSVVDKARRHLYSSTNLPGLDGVDIVAVLEEKLNIPVMIDHDAYYLLAYDIHNNTLTYPGTFLGFYFGTGMGNAIFINGRPYIGKNGTASEVGHMVYPKRDEVCSCGNKGCIEIYSCGKGLERIAAEYFPDTIIREVFEKHGSSKILDDFVRFMAVPVIAEVNILDPDVVFIGGGLAQMKSFPREKLVTYILENTRKPFPAENLDIRFTKPGPENGIIGAALEAYRKLKENNV